MKLYINDMKDFFLGVKMILLREVGEPDMATLPDLPPTMSYKLKRLKTYYQLQWEKTLVTGFKIQATKYEELK